METSDAAGGFGEDQITRSIGAKPMTTTMPTGANPMRTLAAARVAENMARGTVYVAAVPASN